MYFWKVDALAQELKEKKLSQKEKMKYLLVYVLLAVIESLLLVYINYT